MQISDCWKEQKHSAPAPLQRFQHWHLPGDDSYITVTLSTQDLSLGPRCPVPMVMSPMLYQCVWHRDARDKASSPISQYPNGKNAPCASQSSTYLNFPHNSWHFTFRGGSLAHRDSLQVYLYQWELVLIFVSQHHPRPDSYNLFTHGTLHLFPTCEGSSAFSQLDTRKERRGDESCWCWVPRLRTDPHEGRCTLLFLRLNAVNLSTCQVCTVMGNRHGSRSLRLGGSRKSPRPNV